MRKTFPLHVENRDPARVRDKIRQELNRFSRNRHHQPLPEGYTRWKFACKIGPSAAAAVEKPFNQLGGALEQLAASGATEVYIEIDALPDRPEPR